jgi:hypothetical protein
MTVQLIVTGETDIRGQVRDQLPDGYEMTSGYFHATVDVMFPMPPKWSARRKVKMAGTSVTETGNWCQTVLAPLAGLVWTPDALVLPSFDAVWSYVDEPETWIEIEPMIPPTQRAIGSAHRSRQRIEGARMTRSKPSSLSMEATEALRQMTELMVLVDNGSLKATATEKAHLSGAIEGLKELAKIPQTIPLQ